MMAIHKIHRIAIALLVVALCSLSCACIAKGYKPGGNSQNSSSDSGSSNSNSNSNSSSGSDSSGGTSITITVQPSPPPAREPDPPKQEAPPPPPPPPAANPTPQPTPDTNSGSTNNSTTDTNNTPAPPPPAPDNKPSAGEQSNPNSSVTHTINTGGKGYSPGNTNRSDPKPKPNTGSNYSAPPSSDSKVILQDKWPSQPSSGTTGAPAPEPTRGPAPSSSAGYTPGKNTSDTSVTVNTTGKGYNPNNTDYPSSRYRHYKSDRDHSSRSVYHNYDVYPWVDPQVIVVQTPPVVVYRDNPAPQPNLYDPGNPRRDPLNEALADIRNGFLAGRYDLIALHVQPADMMAVFTDGRYDYSINGQDYLDMTYDALETLHTAGFIWEKVRSRSDGAITGFAVHRYFSGQVRTRAVYVSFTLKRIRGDYYITEVGSSANPIN